MAKDTRIFKASEIKYGSTGWIVDLSPSDVVIPDCYWRFPSRAQARLFAALYDKGIDPHEANELAHKLSASSAAAAFRASQSKSKH